MRASKVRLYQGVKIDNSNVTNLSTNDLLTSLDNLKVQEFNDLSLVLTNFTLRVPISYFTAKDCNYMAFLNSDYTQKWYFAYITKVSYVSDTITEIQFKIDYWSTYFTNINFRDCFVEREITASDNIGENTLEESLPVERVEQIERHTESIQSEQDTMFWVAMFTDYDAETDEVTAENITVYNSGFSGHNLVLFRIILDDEIPSGSVESPLEESIKNIFSYILKANTSSKGSIEDIKDLFILPYAIVNQSKLLYHTYKIAGYDAEYYTMYGTIGSDNTDISFAKKLSWQDFVPKNNKCYCYPYNYMLVTNNAGNQNILKYEDFAGSNVTLQIQKAISIGCSIRLVPTNYKGQSIDYDEQIPCAKFPVCGWSADSYINWLTQNSLNLTSQLIGITGQAINAVTDTGLGMIAEAEGFENTSLGIGGLASTAQSVLNFAGQFRKADLMPNIEGGSQNNGDVGFASNSNNFVIKMMRVKLENLRIIDDYFTKYGYKIARVKVPNLTTSRFNHFYVQIAKGEKCVNGNIPLEGINEINKQLSNGLTIWKSLSDIGNYNE